MAVQGLSGGCLPGQGVEWQCGARKGKHVPGTIALAFVCLVKWFRVYCFEMRVHSGLGVLF